MHFELESTSLEKVPNARDRNCQKMNSNKPLLIIFFCGLLIAGTNLIAIDLEITSDAIGVIQYKNELEIFSPEDSLIKKLTVSSGDMVSAGDTLIILQDDSLEIQLNDTKRLLIEEQIKLEIDQSKIEQASITGIIPKLQDIDKMIAFEKELINLSLNNVEISENSLSKNLISPRQYYNEKMKAINLKKQHLENIKLANWKALGLEEKRRSERNIIIENIIKKIDNLKERLRLLQEKKDSLTLKSPINGVVVFSNVKYKNQTTFRGERLLKLASIKDGFVVKAFLGEKNIDLIKKGMSVRMESRVYSSQIDGFLHGQVSEIKYDKDVQEPSDVKSSKFEVTVDLTGYPFLPTPGSRVNLEIIIGKGSIISRLLDRPANLREIDK
jgi:multidrug resistance efflux pump